MFTVYPYLIAFVMMFIFFSCLAVSFYSGKAYSEHPHLCPHAILSPTSSPKNPEGGKALLTIIHKQLNIIGAEGAAMWHTGKIPEQTGQLFDTARKLSPLGGRVCEVVRLCLGFVKHRFFLPS